jgi:hypothetical protein
MTKINTENSQLLLVDNVLSFIRSKSVIDSNNLGSKVWFSSIFKTILI